MTAPWVTLICPNHPKVSVEVHNTSEAWCSKCGTRMVEVGK